jgi:hypothetical protein
VKNQWKKRLKGNKVLTAPNVTMMCKDASNCEVLPNVKNFRTRGTSRREEFSKLQYRCASKLEELLNAMLDIRTGNAPTPS